MTAEHPGVAADVHPANLKRPDTGEHDQAAIAAVTINRSRDDLYAFWRSFENLALVFHNVLSITELDRTRSRWTVRSLGDDPVEWIAIVTDDVPGERIAWRSEDAEIDNSGWVEFRDAPPGRGVEVRAFISWDAPLGPIGDITAKVLKKDPGTIARIELRRLKQLLEAGEIATSRSPAARQQQH